MQAVVVALLSGMESVSCDLCQSENAQVMCRQRDLLQVVTDEEFSVVCCGACGVFYLNNSYPRQEEIGRYYPHQYYHKPAVQPKQRTNFKQKAKELSEMIKRWSGEEYYGYPSPTRRGIWRPIRKIFLWPGKAYHAFP